MKKKIKCNQKAEYSALGKLYSSLLKKPVRVLDVENPDDLAYTRYGTPITLFVAWTHKLYEKLNELEKKLMRKGAATHEFGHQMYTNFDYWEYCKSKKPQEEQNLLHQYLNVLEDCGIEYILIRTFTGTLKKALLFTIKTIYDSQPRLEDIPQSSPLSEYISALIMLGDVGVVKGNFQFPDAKKAFCETAEIFFNATRNPNGKARIDAGVKIFEMTEYLWRQTADDIKAMQEFLDMLKDLGVSNTSGSGSGKNGDIDDSEPTEADKRATKTITVIKKSASASGEGEKSEGSASSGEGEETDENGENGEGSGSGSSSEEEGKSGAGNGEDKSNDSGKEADGKGGSGESDKDEENEDGSGKGSSGKSSEDKGKDGKTSASDKEDEKGDEGNSSDSESKRKSSPASDPNTTKSSASDKSSSDSDDGTPAIGECGDGVLTHTEIDWAEYTMTAEDLEAIEKEIEIEIQNYEKEAVNDSADKTPLMAADGIPEIGTCKNTRVTAASDSETVYNSIVAKLAPQIRRTVKILRDIFATDKEKTYNAPSGKLNANNLYITGDYITRNGSITPNIFRKTESPKNKSDYAIAIAVDESGSMGCRCGSKQRYQVARECAIAFAEIFNQLKIPVYIMGFSADEGKYDTTHYHYVTWKNSKFDRFSLLNISNRSDNRDGASIRYLTKILHKKQAKNKLLIVISDGAPAAYHYSNGEADTAKAVREASSKFPVLGVSIGNSNEETLAGFYKQNFLIVKEGDDLFLSLASKLKKMLK